MEELKNNIEEKETAIESEEVLEVALADNTDEEAGNSANEVNNLTDNYTEYELSGLTDKQRKRKQIIDKLTTGLLILLMASPLLIVVYIFLWFIIKNL